MKKRTTMNDIAAELSVSRVTVWKALNTQPGVSELLRRQIIEKANDLGYPLTLDLSMIESKDRAITVGVVVSRPESSLFWTNIIHSAAKELAKTHINLLYIYVPSIYTPEYELSPILTNGTIQGILVLNLYDETMIKLIDDLPIEKVYLDTVSSVPFHMLHGDIVLLEGYESVRSITNHMADKGITDFGFIGDIAYAHTNRDRYEGFLAAVQERNLNAEPENCFTHSIGIYDYDKEIYEFLDNLPKLPRAFVCVSDFVASFVMQYLMKRDLKVPDQVALSGYDGSSEYASVAGVLTTAVVQTAMLGKRLALQLQYRINNSKAPYEQIYIQTEVKYGSTTDIKQGTVDN